MALSIEEQRILDGMERKLADDDPRLASRLAGFGQPRFAAMAGTGRGRAVILIVSLALAAIVTLMVYSMRPFPERAAERDGSHREPSSPTWSRARRRRRPGHP